MRFRVTNNAGTKSGHTWVGTGATGNAYFSNPADRTLGLSPSTSGNITYVDDIQTQNVNGNTLSGPLAMGPTAGQGTGFWILHCQVKPASNANPNYILIGFNQGVAVAGGADALTINDTATVFTDSAIVSCEISVQEYNAAFSYRANNIGPGDSSTQSQATVWIDNQGIRRNPDIPRAS
jgi:hypothetical protein